MAKVSVAMFADAPAARAQGVTGGETRALFAREGDRLRCHVHTLRPGGTIAIAPARDTILYVWEGEAALAGTRLAAGSSLIVEAGAHALLDAGDEGARLVGFAAADGAGAGTARIHLLPRATVPRFAGEAGGTGGAMHADADGIAPGLWLHENRFPAMPAPATAGERARGIHLHSEDEVIFVTAGAMRLGQRLCGPGTALAVAADTYYGFTSGPDGLGFINFRAGRPGLIRFRNGATIDEVGYWRSRLPRPAPVTLAPA